MKAVRIHEFGGPEVLRYEDVPDPQPRKDQVLVRVKACSLNHLDLWARKGLPGIKLPHILGSDVSGEIVEVGEYVRGLSVGQRVLLSPMYFLQSLCEVRGGIAEPVPRVLRTRQPRGWWQLRIDFGASSSMLPIPDAPRFQSGGKCSFSILDRVAHAGQSWRASSRTNGAGVRSQLRCGNRRHSGGEAIQRYGDRYRRKRKQDAEGPRTRR